MIPRFSSPLRYPGGKAFLTDDFAKIIKLVGLGKPTYVEPYAGGAGAALSLLFSDKVKRIIINDLDKAIYAFWKSAVEKSERFAHKILTATLTIAEWKKQKGIHSNDSAALFERGFATFFLNRTNRSGIMNAWPIGGIKQNSTYKIDARFNKKNLADRIRKIGEYRNRIEVLNEDGIQLTKKYLVKNNTFIYLDPPYFKKGAMLYLSHYNEEDHNELARLLNENANRHWVLTYDEVAKIRDLYPARPKKRLSLQYRVRDSHKARELMIFSDAVAPCR